MSSSRWSYKIVEVKPAFIAVKPTTIEEQLNQLGLQGWELVNVIAYGRNVMLYLKKAH